MAWYYGTFSCGHEGRVNIIGPHKQREWKKERAFEKMCPECWEKYLQEERKRQNKEAAEKAKEMELPELQGTETQVAWANTLRQKLIDRFEKIDKEKLEDITCYYRFKIKYEQLPLILDYILKTYTRASYYIDNRSRDILKVLRSEHKEALKSDEEKAAEAIEKQLQKEILAQATVYPKSCEQKVVAEIKIKNDKVSVLYEKNEDFISIVKSLGYKWDGIWEKKIKETTGTAEERAAELGNKLLNKGFPIRILNHEIRNNAINGIYEPEHTRWIYLRTSGKYEGSVDITWDGRNDKLYRTARSLPGSKWDSGVVVKIEHFEEVQEFAELYDFKFTKAAMNAIEQHKKRLKKAVIVTPSSVEEKENTDGLETILNSSDEIIDDLKD